MGYPFDGERLNSELLFTKTSLDYIAQSKVPDKRVMSERIFNIR